MHRRNVHWPFVIFMIVGICLLIGGCCFLHINGELLPKMVNSR